MSVVPGTQIQVTLRGSLWDRCPEENELDGSNGHSDNTFVDCGGQSWEIAIPVNIARGVDKKFTISVAQFLPPSCIIEPPSCMGGSNPCCHLIQGFFFRIPMFPPASEEYDLSLVPRILIESQPLEQEGMFLGEVRPIRVDFRDLDLIKAECGRGANLDCPTSDANDDKKLCDRPEPEWEVVDDPTAGSIGSGEFLWAKGRVALFRATQEGNVTIRVKLKDGELLNQPPSVIIEFPVRRVVVKSINFAKGHDVLMDAANGDGQGSPARSQYLPPHWLDHDLDGDGTEAGDGKDRRYPLCYTRGSKLALQRVIVAEKDGPVPEYPVVARARCKMGDAPDEVTLFELPLSPVSGAANTRTYIADYDAGQELESEEPFPDSIQLYDPLTIQWEVSFAGGQYNGAGATENFVYVTMTPPVPNQPKAQLLESVLYLSCGAADHGHSEAQKSASDVFLTLYSSFQSLQLGCKPYHGSNVADGRALGYHLNGTAMPNVNVAMSRNKLLETLTPPIAANGKASGSCGAFAQLLLSCAGVQGIVNTHRLKVLPLQDSGILAWGATILGSNSGDPQYPYVFKGEQDTSDDLALSPSPAQGNPAPIQWFIDHDIVRYVGKIYDPSYGLPAQTAYAFWEWLALWGFTDAAEPETKARAQLGSISYEDCFPLQVQW
ncbi:MAG: hypothetical protein ABL998_10650 [Planctomycetota bacterium]